MATVAFAVPIGVWTPKAPLPTAVAEVGVAEIRGLVHVIGGTEQNGQEQPKWASTNHFAYDPKANRWITRAPLPMALSHVGVAALSGKLYAIGGFTDAVHMNPQRVAFSYDPASDEWTRLPDISSPRGSVAAVSVHGKLHVLGGRISNEIVDLPTPPSAPKLQAGFGTVTTHQIFDPKTGIWKDGGVMPNPGRDHVGVAVVDGKIHLFGGRVKDTVDNLIAHDVYDPATDGWTKAAPLTSARSSGAYVVIEGKIIYAGGECKPGGDPLSMTNANAYDEVSMYVPASDSWTDLTALPSARHAFGAATVGKVAYFVGGAPVCGGGASRDLLAFKLK